MEETADDLRAEVYVLEGEIRDVELAIKQEYRNLYAMVDGYSEDYSETEEFIDDLEFDLHMMLTEREDLLNRIKELESV